MSTKDNKPTLRQGVCKNPDCDLCMSHEIQEVEPGADFVCSECGQPLYEPHKKPAKSGSVNKLIIIIAAVVALAVAAFFIYKAVSNKEEAPKAGGETEIVKTGETVIEEPIDTVKPEKADPDTATVATPEPEPQGKDQTDGGKTPNPPAANYGTVRLTYGTYTGPLKGGKPDGMGGEFVFTKSCTIDLKDGYGNTANVGPKDKIISTKFENGVLTQGEIHFTNGTRKYLPGISQKL